MRYPQTILVSCEIPWNERGRLIEEVFRQEIRCVLLNGYRDLYIFGTAGEGYAVDSTAFRQIVQIFGEETSDPFVRPIVGVIDLSTAKIVERISIAWEAGFRAFQITLPCWGAVSDKEMISFFRDVCGAFPEGRFVHYNLLRAKRLVTPVQYRRVCDTVPNLCATKNTGYTPNQIAALLGIVPELQHFLSEVGFAFGCLYGECSLLSSYGALFPKRTRELFQHGLEKRWERLFPLLAEMIKAAENILDPVRHRECMDGAYDKLMKRLGGLEGMPLSLLSPYQGFTEAEYALCRQIASTYIDWEDAEATASLVVASSNKAPEDDRQQLCRQPRE